MLRKISEMYMLVAHEQSSNIIIIFKPIFGSFENNRYITVINIHHSIDYC